MYMLAYNCVAFMNTRQLFHTLGKGVSFLNAQ